MKTSEYKGVYFSTSTAYCRDSQKIRATVYKHKDGKTTITDDTYYSVYGQSLSKVLGLAYRTACTLARSMDRNHAWIN